MSEEYEIGYGRSPKSGQFKKGRSGNPSGRPRASLSLTESTRRAAGRKVTIATATGTKKITKLEASVETLINEGLSKKGRALNAAIKLFKEAGLQEAVSQTAQNRIADLDADDLAVLARLKASLPRADES